VNVLKRKELDQRKYLFWQLVNKDIRIRYQGSVLGMLWSVLLPLLMLIIYTFVFSEIFKAKWNIDTGNKFEFAMVLFCGLCIYNMFSDVLNRSTSLIEINQNYVKKVVFPIEFMPVVITFSALFNCVISIGVLIAANYILTRHVYLMALFTPLILLPHIIFCIGIAFFMSAISVYLKDMASLASIIAMIGMYISPVFFPLSAVPGKFRFVCMLNPMTYSIENMRNILLYGTMPNLKYFCVTLVASFVIYLVGQWIFMRAKSGFADLL
jgi:lipopolysaccharide transport system permease protein